MRHQSSKYPLASSTFVQSMSNDVAQKTTPSVQEPNKHQELLESNHRFVNGKTISYVKTEIIAQTHKASINAYWCIQKRAWHLFHEYHTVSVTLNNASKRTGPWESCPPRKTWKDLWKDERTIEKIWDQSSFKMRSWLRTSLKELAGTAETPKNPSARLWCMMRNALTKTFRSRCPHLERTSLDLSSCPVKCYVYDSWWSCIDPLWIHWSSMDPLLTHSGSTVHSGKPPLIPTFFDFRLWGSNTLPSGTFGLQHLGDGC